MLQISGISQICKICAFACNQLKTIAKIEGDGVTAVYFNTYKYREKMLLLLVFD